MVSDHSQTPQQFILNELADRKNERVRADLEAKSALRHTVQVELKKIQESGVILIFLAYLRRGS